ncbi:restriction endonuclease subunit S [Wohlfahrtiimonas chitiniclastica]|uniref:restriction endonuclease subunit S n=1 Tax=Wohlfahrtiimonas chitiniclastica TaxID=400946 RepID=UPI0007BE99CD|nr:restriction endonuclease subunit S [Wohlfahrtiimonas chitiniclastica]KZS22743.1 restriction modification system DNA specificity subunit [Wohlfahrtiimonas chitiniclastica]WHR55196.1 restriction endonuclease subunit S [Wohlfahrtiimonas chitiniclastica]
MMNYPKYESYKDSGIDWLGVVPFEWTVERLGSNFSERRTKVSDIDFPALSVTKNGVVPQLENAAKTKDGDNRKLVRKGDFVINSRSDRKGSSGVSSLDGSVSLINIILKPLENLQPEFCHHLLKSYAFIEEYYRVGRGIVADLWTTRYDEMRTIMLAVPPIQEQNLIAKFLDQKTSQIDEAIRIKEKQIELLKEQKQIMIQNAVTKGLDPNVRMKDSGVDWIGEIPEHWEVKRAKYLFTEVDERSKDGSEELLSVSHMTGVTPRSEKNVSMFMSEDYTGSKLCKHNDLVINIMWAWMGALGVSNHKGIVSPSYGVFRQKQILSFHPAYLEFLLKTTKYIEHYNQVSTGLHSSRLRFYGHMFFAMKMGYPSYQEQEHIVNFLTEKNSETNNYIDVLEKQIEKLKEYKTTLINSAVTGKIKVTPEMVGEA